MCFSRRLLSHAVLLIWGGVPPASLETRYKLSCFYPRGIESKLRKCIIMWSHLTVSLLPWLAPEEQPQLSAAVRSSSSSFSTANCVFSLSWSPCTHSEGLPTKFRLPATCNTLEDWSQTAHWIWYWRKYVCFSCSRHHVNVFLLTPSHFWTGMCNTMLLAN